MVTVKAYLVLEDGSIFEGKAFGHIEETVGEVVFNTGMTGYQEVLTDPSYEGQIVVMTYPLIGNYGISEEHNESIRPRVKGFVVRECNRDQGVYNQGEDIEQYLKKYGIIGIEDVDTRAITRIIREKGSMRGIITTRKSVIDKDVIDLLSSFSNRDAVKRVTTEEMYHVKPQCPSIAIIDLGVKKSIIQSLSRRYCNVSVFPAFASPRQILGLNPDGILISNGPGDPKDMPSVIDNVKELAHKKPVMGICLGHQVLALALGGDTEKMKYGHRGCNHPVKDLDRGKVYITSQNHGYVVTAESLNPDKLRVTHINLNDGTLEGFRHKHLPIISVQFHPEAAPGPKDTEHIFDEFLAMTRKHKEGKEYNYA
jgi:carbamoyl-phosphate synthase small subunit